jgi:phage-related minor tail protein
MSNSLGEAVLDLAADSAGLIQDINSARPQALTALQAIGVAGGALLAAGIMAAATAVVAITALMWSSANTLDEAYDAIQTRTGATGAELAGLQEDFKTVFTSVPTDAETAANAIGILNSSLGASGPVLQGMTANVLEFSRLTGTDASANAQTFSQMVQNWNIPLDQASGSLDVLFTAAQNTGAPVDALMQQMLSSGPILQQYGMSFEQSAAFMASMTQAGIDAENAMMGLKTAAAKFAADGTPLNEGLTKTVDLIQSAKTPTDALNIAVETFGSRAGPALAQAIQDGKLEFEDLIPLLENADGAVMNAAAATMDWGERLTMFKNKVTTAFAPAGDKLMAVAIKIIDVIAKIFERPDVQAAIQAIANWIGDMAEKGAAYLPVIVDAFFSFVSFLQNNQGIVIAALAAIGVAIAAFVYTTVIPAAIAAITALAPIIAIMALLAGVAYLVYQAWTNNWGGIQTKLTALWTQFQPIFMQLVTWLQTNIPIALQMLSNYWTTVLWPAIQSVWNWLSTVLFPFLVALGNAISTIVGAAVQKLGEIWVNTLLPNIKKAIAWIDTNVLPKLQPIADFFGGKFAEALTAIKDLFQKITDWIKKMTTALENMTLPSWLTPGSPTPLELGLRGINSAMSDLTRGALPNFSAGLQFQTSLGSMLAAGSSQTISGDTYNINGVRMENAGPQTTMQDILEFLNKRR